VTEGISRSRLRVLFALFAVATLLLSLRVGYWQTIGRAALLEGATDQIRSELVIEPDVEPLTRPCECPGEVVAYQELNAVTKPVAALGG